MKDPILAAGGQGIEPVLQTSFAVVSDVANTDHNHVAQVSLHPILPLPLQQQLISHLISYAHLRLTLWGRRFGGDGGNLDIRILFDFHHLSQKIYDINKY